MGVFKSIAKEMEKRGIKPLPNPYGNYEEDYGNYEPEDMNNKEPEYVYGPFKIPYVFYIDKPTTKWNAVLLYHIFKNMGVSNLEEHVWDPHIGNMMYVIKPDRKVYWMAHTSTYITNGENFDHYYPDQVKRQTSLQGIYISIENLPCDNVITGMDTWVMQSMHPGSAPYEPNPKDLCDIAVMSGMMCGFRDYCNELGYEFNMSKGPAFLKDLADKRRFVGLSTKDYKGKKSIEAIWSIYRYLTININKGKEIYLDACATAVGENNRIQVGRKYGPGYILSDGISRSTMIDNGKTAKFRCCPPACHRCKFATTKDVKYHFENAAGPQEVTVPVPACTHEICKGLKDSLEWYDEIKEVGGMYRIPKIKPATKLATPLNPLENSIYKNGDESPDKDNNLKTKSNKVMATTKTTSLFDRMMAKYMAQYKPEKVAGLAMTLDGNIALASGEGEFTAIVDDRLEVYPAEAVLTDIPFFSLQRPINQVKVGDYIFLTTGEGRKLAKVATINKSGNTIKSITVTRFSGTKDDAVPTTDKLTGISTVEVIINFFKDLQFPGMDGDQMNPMLALAFMKDGDDSSMEKLFTMSMLTGNGFQFPGMNGQQNPLITLAMMKEFMGGKDDSSMEKFLMMSMFMGGNNPFTQMMNPGNTDQAPAPKRTRTKKNSDPAPDPDPDPEPEGKDEQ